MVKSELTKLSGLENNIEYQWQMSSNGSDWEDISGENKETISLDVDNDYVGRKIRLEVSYEENGEGREAFSEASPIVSYPAFQDFFTEVSVASMLRLVTVFLLLVLSNKRSTFLILTLTQEVTPSQFTLLVLMDISNIFTWM